MPDSQHWVTDAQLPLKFFLLEITVGFFILSNGKQKLVAYAYEAVLMSTA